MALRPLDLMDPEEAVGNIWHDYAVGIAAQAAYPEAAAELATVRPSLAMMFRALGGAPQVEFTEAPAVVARHRRPHLRRLATERDKIFQPAFDGERLRLPPRIEAYPDPALNRAVYFWLVAVAALSDPECLQAGALAGAARDMAMIRANLAAGARAHQECPGLRKAFAAMQAHTLATRPEVSLPPSEQAVETALRRALDAGDPPTAPAPDAPRSYMPFAPVPFWLALHPPGSGDAVDEPQEDAPEAPAAAATTSRKQGFRKDQEQANRKDSFILHRFESILSWVESMNLNRSIHDDDEENAQKAAEDQDNITLSKNDRRAATRLRLHLDLSPADADHERLADEFTYPEWNHRSRSYMPDHCRVLEVEAEPDPHHAFKPDRKRMEQVRRQFETLRPRRILQPRQIDGNELDLDAAIAAHIDLRASGRCDDRVFLASRQTQRDLTVAFLADTSRSTESAVGDTCVIDVARDALAALAGGIDVAGDRLGIWGFSSLKRDRVFVTRCKSFEQKMSAQVTENICALKPGHYTRLGAAIRHVSAQLAEESAARKLLIVLTDGKPNDLDHYEGQHGIEDSHMAVSEARRTGQTVHGIIIDEDGQDWFARIFGRGGFHLLPRPDRLTRVLPDIYRSLTQES
ncbi:nitric oxide reductase activation protein NorD [Pararhodobacter oceanensis]|uniref:NorD nitric oxide reductase activation protein n=1 Tax=Pararhodobacter oceanensis TaxID=2172121 RepID=A0A2T8HTM7_9RHOB|nr:VWA domain-containing protein [Pararhodobacter oceanensis]PVH28797.1 NorD nitric oxide reductase activation protein [Pararhodobacter oceanensis]